MPESNWPDVLFPKQAAHLAPNPRLLFLFYYIFSNLQIVRESNSQQKTWKLPCCHYTNDLFSQDAQMRPPGSKAAMLPDYTTPCMLLQLFSLSNVEFRVEPTRKSKSNSNSNHFVDDSPLILYNFLKSTYSLNDFQSS